MHRRRWLTLAFATLLLPAGALGDRYGRQRAGRRHGDLRHGLAGRFLIPVSKAPHRRRFDPPGILLGILASAGLTYTVIEAGSALGLAIPAGTALLTAIITYRYLPRH